jgi:hypothetical protein
VKALNKFYTQNYWVKLLNECQWVIFYDFSEKKLNEFYCLSLAQVVIGASEQKYLIELFWLDDLVIWKWWWVKSKIENIEKNIGPWIWFSPKCIKGYETQPEKTWLNPLLQNFSCNKPSHQQASK